MRSTTRFPTTGPTTTPSPKTTTPETLLPATSPNCSPAPEPSASKAPEYLPPPNNNTPTAFQTSFPLITSMKSTPMVLMAGSRRCIAQGLRLLLPVLPGREKGPFRLCAPCLLAQWGRIKGQMVFPASCPTANSGSCLRRETLFVSCRLACRALVTDRLFLPANCLHVLLARAKVHLELSVKERVLSLVVVLPTQCHQ